MKIRLYLLQTTCSKPSLWSWRGDLGCRGIRLLPSSSVSSSTSSAAFPGGRSLPLFIDGTKRHFPGQNGKAPRERRDKTSGTEGPGQKGLDRRAGTERLGSLVR